ncbi:deaminase [Chryseobacterium sp.]|uniref:deaminase n=1 Tax=Chryseobacterium sp. TaxID=1871047 RepID=UPI00289C0FA8|nr:deaminase [Chryseobacterium sp.]
MSDKKLTNLDFYEQKTVQFLTELDPIILKDEEKIRHYAYSLLVMAITKHFWNGNKEGNKKVSYPLNPKDSNEFEFDSYLGHNICAIAVDKNGKVIDFEFNHNKVFKSSIEHAETRLVRRIYNLAQLHETYKFSDESFQRKDEANTFNDVSIYTSLESCSQCSGVMALAKVKEIIYLQEDPGMYKVGNILRNLTKKIVGYNNNDLEAPLPISADLFGFSYKKKLEEAYDQFTDDMDRYSAEYKLIEKDEDKKAEYIKLNRHFSLKDGKPKYSNSLTSFLCTQNAYKIYSEAEEVLKSKDEYQLLAIIVSNLNANNNVELNSLINNHITLSNEFTRNTDYNWEDFFRVNFSNEILEYKPDNSNDPEVKNNLEVLREVLSFYKYIKTISSRATQHK